MRSIACPKCRTKLAGSPDLLGVAVRCSKCGEVFTASVANSPYVEGLPPLPNSRRPLILGGAVALSLLLVTGLVLGLNWLEDSKDDNGLGTGGITPPVERKAPEVSNRKMMTANGIPIEVPEDDGPDRLPAPGGKLSAALEKTLAMQEKEAAKVGKSAKAVDEVALAFAKWDTINGQRILKIGYGFGSGQSPVAGVYVLKLKVNNDPNNVASVAMETTLAANGVVSFTPEKIPIGELRPPKVEAWVERNTAGIGVKVSNVVSTE